MASSASCLAAAALLAPAAAVAHLGGVPTTAWFTEPDTVGIVVDGSYVFRWTDFDDLADTDDTRIDFYFTDAMPPTYRMGSQPEGLRGTAIEKAVPEYDLDNFLEWDTSEVPAGTYFLYSIAHDPPFEMIAFARGAVTVAHEGDPVWPAVIVTKPDGNGDVARGSFPLGWEAFDPDGSGQVRIEATQAWDGTDLVVLAEGLDPAAGGWTWDTSGVTPGEWSIRMTLEDGRGLSHQAWGRFFVRVQAGGGTGGSGGSGGTGGTGGTGGIGGEPGGDAGAPGTDGGKKGGGGGCSAAGSSLGVTAWLALLFASPLARRRTRR